MTTRDWDTVGFVVRQPMYRNSVVRTQCKPTEQPQMVDSSFHRSHLDVQGSSTYDASKPFDLD